MNKVLVIALVFIQAQFAFSDQFTTLDAPALCDWYRQSDGCYRQTSDALNIANNGVASYDKKTGRCNFADGSFVFSRDFEWMFNGGKDPARWEFNYRDAAGKQNLFSVTVDSLNSGAQTFSIIQYIKKTSVLYDNANSYSGSIAGSVECDLPNGDHSVSTIPWKVLKESTKLCLDIAQDQLPRITVQRNGNSIKVVTFLNGKDATFFSCRRTE